jgi:collagenase-like PrtC family protease
MNKKYSKRIFSIPLRWEKSFIDDVLKSETEKGIIGCFYGCIDFEGVRNGRVPLKHQKIEVKNAKKVVEYIHQCGRRIKYLINAPEPSSGEQDISDIIQIIIDELGVDAVVVSSYKMMDRIRNHSLSIDIHVSTIARVSSPTELELYTQFSPVRLIPQHDVPKKPNTLSVLLQSCKKKKIDLEIMVTESCLFECPWMQSHYQSLADGHEDREHHRLCREARQKTPSHLIACGSFIRP